MGTVNLKAVAQDLVAKGKYPKKDGGVLSLSGDLGDIIVLREGTKVTYQFTTVGKDVKLDIGAPQVGAVAKPLILPKKVAPLAPGKVVAKKKVEEPDAPKEPVWVEQMGYDRQPETVDLNLHPNIITCECGNVRYVANGDMHQVTECKPCTRLHRRQRRRASKKQRGSTDKGLKFPAKKEAAKKAIAKPLPTAPRKATNVPAKGIPTKKK